jgi:hypothetical protein
MKNGKNPFCNLFVFISSFLAERATHFIVENEKIFVFTF